LPPGLRAYYQTGTDLPQLDHVGYLHYSRKNPQASVGYIEDEAICRKAEHIVYRTGGRRLEIIAAHRPVNQSTNVLALYARGFDGLLAARYAYLARQGSRA